MYIQENNPAGNAGDRRIMKATRWGCVRQCVHVNKGTENLRKGLTI